MSEEKFWFGFRHTHPSPPGRAAAYGPYSTWEEAKKQRENAKAWDCSVSVPFTADTQEDANEKAEKLT